MERNAEARAAPTARPRWEVAVPTAPLMLAGAGGLWLLVRGLAAANGLVGGAELASLAGAWSAKAGEADARFVPTLAQALTAAAFELTPSPYVPRFLLLALGLLLLAVAVAWLRPVAGDARLAALVALAAIDPLGIALGLGSAEALDGSVALLLLAVSLRPPASPVVWGIVGFLTAAGGATLFPAAVAFAGAAIVAVPHVDRRRVAWLVGGAAAAALAASFGFGFGWQGVTVPMFEDVGAVFDGGQATAPAWVFAVLYGGPLLAAGALAAASILFRPDALASAERALVAWWGVAVAGIVAAGSAEALAPAASASLASLVLAAWRFPSAVAGLRRCAWREARWAVALLLGLLGVAAMSAFSWAHGRLGAGSGTLALALAAAAAVLTASLLRQRRTRAAALVPGAAIAAAWLVAMASRAAAPSWHEPLYSPLSSPQDATLRFVALELRGDGQILVHPGLEEAAVWPLRDVGTIAVGSRPEAGDSLLIWPADAAAPEGYRALEGRWTLTWSSEPPRGLRSFLRWLSDRNSLPRGAVEVRIFTRAEE